MSWRLGSYKVEDRPFAAGATAEVFLGRHGRGGHRVALKVLRLGAFGGRAESEAGLAVVDHPRLIRVRERIIDERRGVVGLVMDLAQAGDLRSCLRSANPPSPLAMIELVDDILAGLGALHDAGVVHRDVKPENVVLDRIDGRLRARLGDMGIARPANRTRSTGSVLGTDLYIAPEVHDGGPPTMAADLWAVGYVLYEGLFGAPPHADAATAFQAIGRLRTQGPDRPAGVPDEIWSVVAKMLARDPADRPASTREARDLLASTRAVAAAIGAPDRDSGAARHEGTLPRGVGSSARLDTPVAVHHGTLTRPRPYRPAQPFGDRVLLTRAVALVVLAGLAVAGIAWVGGRRDVAARPAAPIAATRALAPLSPEPPGVVPTQYLWRLSSGVLSAHLEVVNPTATATLPATLPELFPASLAPRGRLVLDGATGMVESQSDGSVLVRFGIPSLGPGQHYVVRYRVTMGPVGDERRALEHLGQERDAAIARHAFVLSDTPTLNRLQLQSPKSELVVGERIELSLAGFLADGTRAPSPLVQDATWAVVSGDGVVDLAGGVVTARRAGATIVSATVGALEARLTLQVTEPAPPVTARARRHSPTTGQEPTVIVREDPPPPHESFLVLGRNGHRSGAAA